MPVQEIDLGKVVGPPGPPGADGSPGERGPGTNTNLLDNWYFIDPINQRGETSYSGTAGYTVDRWKVSSNKTLSLESGGVRLSSGTAAYSPLSQALDIRAAKGSLAGATVTLSFLVEEMSCGSFEVFVSTPTASGASTPNYGIQHFKTAGLASITATLPSVIENDLLCAFIAIDAPSLGGTAGSLKIKAAKLELGDTQTLAHQDANGNWVLNDPPPDKALELAKCQRYYQRYDKDGFCGIARFATYVSGPSAILFIPTPVTMRANPAVVISGQFDTYTAAGESIETYMTYSGGGTLSDNGITVMSVPVSDEFETAIGLFRPYDGGLIELSAEL